MRVAARGALGVRRDRVSPQQNERAPRHRRHRRLRLPLPPTFPHAHVRKDRATRQAGHTVRPDVVGGRQRARCCAGGGRGVPSEQYCRVTWPHLSRGNTNLSLRM